MRIESRGIKLFCVDMVPGAFSVLSRIVFGLVEKLRSGFCPDATTNLLVTEFWIHNTPFGLSSFEDILNQPYRGISAVGRKVRRGRSFILPAQSQTRDL